MGPNFQQFKGLLTLGWSSWQGAGLSTRWEDEFEPCWGLIFAWLLGQTLGQIVR
jgi:hypothetical protein